MRLRITRGAHLEGSENQIGVGISFSSGERVKAHCFVFGKQKHPSLYKEQFFHFQNLVVHRSILDTSYLIVT